MALSVITAHEKFFVKFLSKIQRIAFRLMLSSCVSLCVCVCRVCGPHENGLR